MPRHKLRPKALGQRDVDHSVLATGHAFLD